MGGRRVTDKTTRASPVFGAVVSHVNPDKVRDNLGLGLAPQDLTVRVKGDRLGKLPKPGPREPTTYSERAGNVGASRGAGARVGGKPVAPAVTSGSGLSHDSRLSADFTGWLREQGYREQTFVQGVRPAFGGRSKAGQRLHHRPVIFIHGNSDHAAGWSHSHAYFRQQGYGDHELYGFTWGPGGAAEATPGAARLLLAAQQTHSKAYVTELRTFIEAVLAYTGAEKADIVSHSMGVTLARKAVQGGSGRAQDGDYDLGPALTNRVQTFIGIAGANRGLTAAFWAPGFRTSNPLDGFYPGVFTPLGIVGVSRFLDDLNNSGTREGRACVPSGPRMTSW